MSSKKQKRSIKRAKSGDGELSNLQLLPGKWENTSNLKGRGWNFIGLPFKSSNPDEKINYRLLLNQYNEKLIFAKVGKNIPNRGIERNRIDGISGNRDQLVNALDYEQEVVQIAVDDFPVSKLRGGLNIPIHHEPGLFLQIVNEAIDDLKFARLASIPHGNSVLALGRVRVIDGPPDIPVQNGLPIGIPNMDVDRNPYLSPYKYYKDNPFVGIFNPLHPNELLREENRNVEIKKTTEFHFDTEFETGGIHNIPFIKKQANATRMHSTFWLQELKETDDKGQPKLRLQYTQTVYLEFFNRHDGKPGLIKWPHVSINTLEKAK